MDSDEQRIRQTHDRWMAAVNAGDLDRLLNLMTDDCQLLNPGQDAFGKEGFSPVFLGAHRRYQIRCESKLQEVVVAGNLAYTRSRDSLSLIAREGDEKEHFAGDRLTIYRKQSDGRWLLARDAHTLSAVERK